MESEENITGKESESTVCIPEEGRDEQSIEDEVWTEISDPEQLWLVQEIVSFAVAAAYEYVMDKLKQRSISRLNKNRFRLKSDQICIDRHGMDIKFECPYLKCSRTSDLFIAYRPELLHPSKPYLAALLDCVTEGIPMLWPLSITPD